jgi:D-apiose dehydrogenase
LPGYEIRLTTATGTASSRHPPATYSWVDPAYAVVQSSIVDCHRDLLRGIADANYTPETTAEDNLRTLALVFAAYRSAATNGAIQL